MTGDGPSAALGGRRREAARNNRTIDLAAREAVARLGPGAPMMEVARRAGVGIASVYRRYPTRQALLDRLARTALDELVAAATVAARTPDPHHAVRRLVDRLVEQRTGALLPLLAQLERTPDVDSALMTATRELDEVVARGRAAGVIRRDATAADVVRLSHRFALADPGSADRRSLGLAVDGLLLVANRALPGPEPSWSSLVGAIHQAAGDEPPQPAPSSSTTA